jgi:hypothetical protein
MICKKCKKECLESELENGICQDCATKGKNYMIVQIVISVAISVVLSLTIIGWANNEVSLSDFKIESFDMETEKTTYTYTGDSLTYSGKGIISCKNKDKDYLVLIEENNKTSNETDYNYIVVHNGKGEFSTYDSSYLGAKEKPSYEFNIIGYRSFKK